jgi:hypothetical protein
MSDYQKVLKILCGGGRLYPVRVTLMSTQH